MNGHMCQGRSTPYIGDGHPPFIGNPYNGYINPYYWVDDQAPIILGNTGSLDHTTHIIFAVNPEAPSICSKRFAFQRMIFRPSVPFDSASTCDRLHHEQENAIKLNKGNLGICFFLKTFPHNTPKPLSNKIRLTFFLLGSS